MSSSVNSKGEDRKSADERLALSVADACRALSVSRSHLYALASKGEVRLSRLGSRTLVSMSEIRRLLGEVA
ncbi:helix-turn-helix domain-containing protein [Methylocystis sp.]|uniref:helix-turn-helix domain-containing protein n=1 Tax=Methylocystis sp. TaxID=1911079 RepID=UPI00345C3396